MNLGLFLAPSLQRVPSQNALLNKLISVILTTIVMTGATFSAAVTHAGGRLGRPGKVDTRTSRPAAIKAMPMGISRKRPAFQKAIEMLADGAAASSTLADYYRSATRRMKGQTASGDTSLSPFVKLVANSGQEGSLTGIIPLVHMQTLSLDQPARLIASDDSQLAARPREQSQECFTVGDMNFEMNAAIQHWTDYFASTPRGRKTMKVGMDRSNTFLEMARAKFREAGIPEDLVWLAFVESVWNPRAVSPAAAGGLWQFMPVTATDYGLKVQSGCDERNDPVKQTRVAAKYLHDLYTIFGNWELAMAAYNSGEPRVMGAIVKNGRADFWEMYDKQLLPKETRDYVPKILASIKVAGQPAYYGLTSRAGSASPSVAMSL
jgi:hypothetical protein